MIFLNIANFTWRMTMVRLMFFSRLALVLAALATIAAVSLSAQPAHAVVYCKTVGVPKGCVVRPVPKVRVVYCTAPGVPAGCVVRPVVRPRPVVYCKTRGVPKGCVVR
jgi:hypothetical protein